MAKLAKEITVETDNNVGTLSKVTGSIKEAGVNLLAVCGWGEEDKGTILTVTDDNAKAIEVLTQAGFAPKEKEVILVEVAHRVGSLADVAHKLSEAGVNIIYCYVSATTSPALAVLSTRDNAKALAALGQ